MATIHLELTDPTALPQPTTDPTWLIQPTTDPMHFAFAIAIGLTQLRMSFRPMRIAETTGLMQQGVHQSKILANATWMPHATRPI